MEKQYLLYKILLKEENGYKIDLKKDFRENCYIKISYKGKNYYFSENKNFKPKEKDPLITPPSQDLKIKKTKKIIKLKGSEFKDFFEKKHLIKTNNREDSLELIGFDYLSNMAEYKEDKDIYLIYNNYEIESYAIISNSNLLPNDKTKKELTIINTNNNNKNQGNSVELLKKIMLDLKEKNQSLIITKLLKEGEKYLKETFFDLAEEIGIDCYRDSEAQLIKENLYNNFFKKIDKEDYIDFEKTLIEELRLGNKIEEIMFDILEEIHMVYPELEERTKYRI